MRTITPVKYPFSHCTNFVFAHSLHYILFHWWHCLWKLFMRFSYQLAMSWCDFCTFCNHFHCWFWCKAHDLKVVPGVGVSIFTVHVNHTIGKTVVCIPLQLLHTIIIFVHQLPLLLCRTPETTAAPKRSLSMISDSKTQPSLFPKDSIALSITSCVESPWNTIKMPLLMAGMSINWLSRVSIASVLSKWGSRCKLDMPTWGTRPSMRWYRTSLNVQCLWVLYLHIYTTTNWPSMHIRILHPCTHFYWIDWLTLSTPSLDSDCLSDPQTIQHLGHRCHVSVFTSTSSSSVSKRGLIPQPA